MTKLNKQQESIVNFAFEYVPGLSEYEKQEISLEKKGIPKNSLSFKKEIDTAKIAEKNKINELRKKAFRMGVSPVQLILQWRIEQFDARDRELDYAQFIKRDGKRISKPQQNETLKQLMPCTDANKKMFYLNYLKPMFLDRGVQFNIDHYNKKIIAELFKYFIQDPTCKLDLKKGIFLCGPVGTGKTSIMEAFSKFTNDFNFINSFNMVYMEELNIEIDEHGLACLKKFKFGDYCFDDIAIRETKINSYGTDVMPSDEIMQLRYRRFAKLNSRPTHYTSNINFNLNEDEEQARKELESRYNKRAIDRTKMCNFVYLDGPSRRKI